MAALQRCVLALMLIVAAAPASLAARSLLRLPRRDPRAGASAVHRELQQQQGFWSGFPPPSANAAYAAASASGQQGAATSAATVIVAQQPQQQPAQVLIPQQQQQQPQQLVMGQPQAEGMPQPQQLQQQQQQQQPQQWVQQQAPMAGAAAQAQSSTSGEGSAPTAAAPGASGLEASLLPLHNSLRARHGAPALAWSGELAGAAQAWANRCVFQHSGPGENLAQYFSEPTAAVQAWYDEIKGYDYAAGQYSAQTGHATQLLWKASTQLGCGWAAGCQLLVCRYSPPGNVIGQFVGNVDPPTGSA